MVNEPILLGKRRFTGFVRSTDSVEKAMKLVASFCVVLALIIGCGGEPNLDDPKVREKVLSEAIDAGTLQTRRAPSGEELRYAPNQERPYAGWVKDVRDEAWGDVRELYQFQNGKPNGLYISWFWNNQKNQKGNFRDGEKTGLWTRWHDNGQKWEKGTYKNGEKDGVWTEWDQNGQVVWHGEDRDRGGPLTPIEQETTSEPVD